MSHRSPTPRRFGVIAVAAIALVASIGVAAARSSILEGDDDQATSSPRAAVATVPAVVDPPVETTPSAPATTTPKVTRPDAASERRLDEMVRFKTKVLRELVDEKTRARALAREQATAKATFRIGTYNILGSNHAPNGQGRARTSAGLITSRGVDVIGLQEVQKDQQGTFESAMPGYSFWPRAALGNQGYRHQIAWRSSMFEYVDGGSVDYTFTSMRIPMPWIRLRHLATGAEFYLINTHNSARNLEGERDSATAIEISLINQLRQSGLPVFIVGDMNEHTEFFCKVAPATGMVAANGGSGGGGCSLPPGPLRVDWIMGAGASFSGYVQDGASISTGASDHYFLHADATIGFTPDPDIMEAGS